MRTAFALSACIPLVVVAAGTVMRRALQWAGLSEKQAALEMGMDAAQVSRQLSGQEHLHLDRWLQIPGVAEWLAVVLAVDAGLPAEVQTLRRLRMARMALLQAQKTEVAS